MLIAISALTVIGLVVWINSIPDFGTPNYYYGTRRGIVERADVNNREVS